MQLKNKKKGEVQRLLTSGIQLIGSYLHPEQLPLLQTGWYMGFKFSGFSLYVNHLLGVKKKILLPIKEGGLLFLLIAGCDTRLPCLAGWSRRGVPHPTGHTSGTQQFPGTPGPSARSHSSDHKVRGTKYRPHCLRPHHE